MAAEETPGWPFVDYSISHLIKLAEVNPRFRSLLEMQATDADPVEIWKMATSEELLDGAYALRLKGFENLPPKNAMPYQVISDDDYAKLVHPREYLRTRYSGALDGEAARRIREDAMRQQDLANQLALVNEDVWYHNASPENLVGLVWLAKNFTMEEGHLANIMMHAAEQGKLTTAKQFYDTYRDKISPERLLLGKGGRLSIGDPFYKSMVEDRAHFAAWLADTYDMRDRVHRDGNFLFTKLFELNNLAAIEWLVVQYGTPPLTTVFNTDDVSFIGKELWLMEKYGRAELSRFLAAQYHIAPVPMTPEEVKNSHSRFAQQPPPTKRLSQVPKGFWLRR